jgi:hypothetical protein
VSQPPSTRVLALDLSTSVGWAFGESADLIPKWGVWVLPGPEHSLGLRFNSFRNAIEDALDKFQPDEVWVERPIPQRDNNVVAGEMTLGLHAHLSQMIFDARTDDNRELRFERPSVDMVRSKVIGRSRLTEAERKARMKVKPTIVKPWIEKMGWGIDHPDAADAAIVWAYAIGLRAPRPRKN